MSRFQNSLSILMLILGVFVVGCESEPTLLDRNFGSSVRDTIERQTVQPGDRGYALDGQKSEVVWQAYRKDAADPAKVEQKLIQIQLGK